MQQKALAAQDKQSSIQETLPNLYNQHFDLWGGKENGFCSFPLKYFPSQLPSRVLSYSLRRSTAADCQEEYILQLLHQNKYIPNWAKEKAIIYNDWKFKFFIKERNNFILM